MDDAAKKTTLRMIPYGIYVMTSDDGKGNVGAATVNWVTQSSFAPPLVVVGVAAAPMYAVKKGTSPLVFCWPRFCSEERATPGTGIY